MNPLEIRTHVANIWAITALRHRRKDRELAIIEYLRSLDEHHQKALFAGNYVFAQWWCRHKKGDWVELNLHCQVGTTPDPSMYHAHLKQLGFKPKKTDVRIRIKVIAPEAVQGELEALDGLQEELDRKTVEVMLDVFDRTNPPANAPAPFKYEVTRKIRHAKTGEVRSLPPTAVQAHTAADAIEQACLARYPEAAGWLTVDASVRKGK